MTANHRYTSPLRYPGGKGKLTDYVKLIIQSNGLIDGTYCEPYAGGSSVALALLFEEYVSQAHINDLNASVYAFWSSVLYRADALCALIEDVEVTMDEWYRQKEVQANAAQHSLLELGFSTFFLNRTNRSGIIKGGVIGGKGQTGKWKLDARFNKVDLTERIRKIARYRSRIHLHNLDAKDFILGVLPGLPAETLVYLDPPYYVKGEGLYDSFYTHADHLEISRLVKRSIKQHWIVSYDAEPAIEKLYAKCNGITYGLNYSAQDRYEGAEVMFFSKSLRIPDIANPRALKAA
jgi:DNA adenine methylase